MDVLFRQKPAIVSMKYFDITPSAIMNCSFGSFSNLCIRKKSEVDCILSEIPVHPDSKSARSFSETYVPNEL